MKKTHRTASWSRNRKFQLLAVVLPFTLLLFSGLAIAGPQLVPFTPTVFYYLPLMVKVPTPTPTVTPTATATPVETVPPPGSNSVSGSLTLETVKSSYATKCEDVWFYEVIHNDDTARSLNWGILGVAVNGPGTNVFHTSWSAPGAPGQVFTLDPNCFGPNGMPCAGSADAGRHRDAIGGTRPDSRLLYPGTYNLSLSICLSPYDACANGAGTWRVLSSVSIVAVDWAGCPAAPANQAGTAELAAPTPTPDPLAGCRLDQSNPNRIHLVCLGK